MIIANLISFSMLSVNYGVILFEIYHGCFHCSSIVQNSKFHLYWLVYPIGPT